MRLAGITIFLVALMVPMMAFAGNGYKLDVTMKFGFGEEFAKMMADEMKAEMGDEAGDMDMAEMMSMFMPDDMGATVYTDGSSMRMDISMGEMGSSTTIYNMIDKTMYMLDHDSMTAMEFPLGNLAETYGAAGFMDMQPEDIFTHFDEYLEMMSAVPGMDVKQLTGKTLIGHACKGISFTGNMSEMMEAYGSEEEMPGMPFGEMDMNYAGTIYYSEKLNMPLHMSFEMMGMTYDWIVDAVNEWTPDNAMFAVPADYTIEEMPDWDEMGEMYSEGVEGLE